MYSSLLWFVIDRRVLFASKDHSPAPGYIARAIWPGTKATDHTPYEQISGAAFVLKNEPGEGVPVWTVDG